MIEFRFRNTDHLLYRVYPKLDQAPSSSPQINKDGNWHGNGSGLIISQSGYIVTNNHVIEGANEIEVEFLINDKVQRFNARTIQVDKVNDLVIIKIFDNNLTELGNKVNFENSSDVGKKCTRMDIQWL